MTDDTALIARLRQEEGWKQHPYRDSKGILTIGCGRNLEAVGLSDDEIAYLLKNDIAAARAALDRNLPWWRELDPVRQSVLTDMCFNMGIGVLLEFKHMFAFAKAGDFNSAASEMLASPWAREVGARATNLASQMRLG